jgi:hypothetical protein
MGESHQGIKRATADIGVILKFDRGNFLKFVRVAKKCLNGKYRFLQKMNNFQFRLWCMIIGINP